MARIKQRRPVGALKTVCPAFLIFCRHPVIALVLPAGGRSQAANSAPWDAHYPQQDQGRGSVTPQEKDSPARETCVPWLPLLDVTFVLFPMSQQGSWSEACDNPVKDIP